MKIVLPTPILTWFLSEVPNRSRSEMVALLKREHAISISEKTGYRIARENGIKFRTGHKAPHNKGKTKLTPEAIKYLREALKNTSIKGVLPELKKQFGINISCATVSRACSQHKIPTKNTQFKPGHSPWSLGQKYKMKPHASRSQKQGLKPHNTRPIGAEQIKGNGYVYIKVETESGFAWRPKQQIVWEKHNQKPLTKGHLVRFIDGNNQNFDPDNLLAIPHSHHSQVQKFGKIYGKELIATTSIIAIDHKIRDMSNEASQ